MRDACREDWSAPEAFEILFYPIQTNAIATKIHTLNRTAAGFAGQRIHMGYLMKRRAPKIPSCGSLCLRLRVVHRS